MRLFFKRRPIPESALAYCRSLARHVENAYGREPLTPEVWTVIMGAEVPPPGKIVSGLLAEKYLAPNVAAQARLASMLEYPPSKWLLEREMEARGIWPGSNHLHNTPPTDVYEIALRAKMTGVCFSGGGIRSATFNLGVLQAIAAEGKLGAIDYLSTVSGGGYIHLFLASWIHRKGLAHVEEQLHPLPAYSSRTAWPESIRWLRRYSNYLTPRKGFFTADTWAAISIWLRNTFLNQLVLISALLTFLLLPHFPVLSAVGFKAARLPSYWVADDLNPPLPGLFALLCFMVAAIAVGIGLFTTPHPVGTSVFTTKTTDNLGILKKRRGFGGRLVFLTITLPLFLAIFTISPFLYRSIFFPLYPLGGCSGMPPSEIPDFVFRLHALTPPIPPTPFGHPAPCPAQGGTPHSFTANVRTWFHNFDRPEFWTPFSQRRSWAFAVFAAGNGLLALAFVGAVPMHKGHSFSNVVNVLLVITAAFVCVSASLVLLHLARILLLVAAIAIPYAEFVTCSIIFAPILLLSVVFVSLDLAIGVVGRSMLDSSREWLADVRSFSFIASFAWLGIVGCSLLGPVFISFLIHRRWELPAGVLTAWASTTAASILAGKSSSTGAPEDKAPAPNPALSLLIYIGPPVFMVGLMLLLSFVLQTLLESFHIESPLQYVFTLVAFASFALFFSWRVDINEFSLHSFYRDRIARCYAGASDPDRRPNALTGLAVSDEDLRLARLLPKRFGNGDPSLWADSTKPSYEGPFPIFSATLNLTFGEDLATQERKAACFAFTPLFCGYDIGWTQGEKSSIQFNGYVPTRSFAYPEQKGPTVSTAVSASGAALNPNDGFQTNTAMAFLLSFFNARLGWWLPNPRYAGGIFNFRSRPTPLLGLHYLLEELFGMVSDDAPFVNVSDGGQFENMGLYELVRRRCRNILICDAEADAKFSFEGLGMAVRRCRIDFGVEVNFPKLEQVLPLADGFSPFGFAKGTIHYPNPTYPHDPIRGKVLYIKSTLTGVEPVDIRNYKREHPMFANQSTLNQWFTESQFESYRRLGQLIAQQEGVTNWLKAL
jgi:hypothetical protein